MAYEWLTWLPSVLRSAGITVVEHDGWARRGLSSKVMGFRPRYVVWHHDASPVGDSPGVPAYMIRNFQKAGAQIWVDRKGRWHLVAAGRAPHAGVVKPGKPGNSTSIGIETDHTTGEKWPEPLLASLRIGTAAILYHLKQPVSNLEFHKTICFPPGRKNDPAGLDLVAERSRVGKEIVNLNVKPVAPKPPAKKPVAPKPPAKKPVAPKPPVTPTVSLSKLTNAAKLDPKRKASAYPSGTKVVEAALVAEKLLATKYLDGHYGTVTIDAYKKWQRKCGFTGKAADGIPGPKTLMALGAKHGFKVGK